jgi:hypothetical protein
VRNWSNATNAKMVYNDIHNDLGHITLDAAWGRIAQIVLIDPFTAGVGVGRATENRNWL